MKDTAYSTLIIAACLLNVASVRYTEGSTDIHEIQTDDTLIQFACPYNSRPVTTVCRAVDPSKSNWIRKSSEVELPQAVEIEGRSRKVKWRYVGASSTNRKTIFTYRSDNPNLMLISTWQYHPGPGPVEHTVRLTNESDKPLTFSPLPSITLTVPADLAKQLFWVEQGEGAPSGIGTHVETIGPDFARTLFSGPNYTHKGKPREAIPWFCLHDPKTQQGIYGGIEFTGFTEITLTKSSGGDLTVELGLYRREGKTRSRIDPGETFEFPTCFVGAYTGSVDDGCNRLHRWVENHLRPPLPAAVPMLANNTWAVGLYFDIDEKKSYQMIDNCAELGIELFEIDAGWFTFAGDWNPDPNKFPNGIKPIADYAHAKGIKFGIWTAWSHGTTLRGRGENILNPLDPVRRSWFQHDYAPGWRRKPPWEGAPLCLGCPQARTWCLQLLRRIVTRFDLDVLRHDQIVVVDNCTRRDHRHVRGDPGDVSRTAANGYYEIYDKLRAEFPNLFFEGCNGGGRTADFGFLKRVHFYQIEDSYHPLTVRRAFYDASFPFPPSTLLQWIRSGPREESLTAFKFRLRSAMLGCCSVQMDTTAWSGEQRNAAKQQFDIYKSRLRPLIASADMYHVLPRPDGKNWDGIEYFDPDKGKGALIVFRPETDLAAKRIKLRGLRPEKLYSIESVDGSVRDTKLTGKQLTESGLALKLPEPDSSDFVFFSEVRQ